MRTDLLFVLLCAVLPARAQETCMTSGCPVGSFAVTYGSKEDPFYACPTRELSDYTNAVLGAVALVKQFTGTFPSISPVTGEPEFKEETKAFLARLRLKAGVRTFDEAVAQCGQGPHKKRVQIANYTKGEMSMWVADAKNPKSMFWMPTSSADPVK